MNTSSKKDDHVIGNTKARFIDPTSSEGLEILQDFEDAGKSTNRGMKRNSIAKSNNKQIIPLVEQGIPMPVERK